MPIEPEYAEVIIVGVRFKMEWSWYVSKIDYWFLDMDKRIRVFLEKGYQLPNESEKLSFRDGIRIVDKQNAHQFLQVMQPFRVDALYLRDILLQRSKQIGDYDILDMVPSLLVDFDTRTLQSLYPENIAFENYVPHGWKGEFGDFLGDVPGEQRYWIVDGVNYIVPAQPA